MEDFLSKKYRFEEKNKKKQNIKGQLITRKQESTYLECSQEVR